MFFYGTIRVTFLDFPCQIPVHFYLIIHNMTVETFRSTAQLRAFGMSHADTHLPAEMVLTYRACIHQINALDNW